jgi:pimeloyl-ACP methyl ester carboxylesterase
VLVCVHGLSRPGRDVDTLAQAMLPHWRVVCPDVVGRGQSDWLRDPNGYTLATYVADMVTLLARLDATQVDWVGTSMGGLIGLLLAALPGAPVRRLVLNDVGPIVQFQALQRIGQYLGYPVRWRSEQEAADALWTIASSFGPHTPEQWLALTRPQLRDDGQGGFKPHYDPDIAVPFRAVTAESAQAGEAQLWKAYDALRSQTLLVRGAESDLLSRDTAIEMTQRGPRARLVEFEGVGHAPTLVQPDQVAAVRDFLLAA